MPKIQPKLVERMFDFYRNELSYSREDLASALEMLPTIYEQNFAGKITSSDCLLEKGNRRARKFARARKKLDAQQTLLAYITQPRQDIAERLARQYNSR